MSRSFELKDADFFVIILSAVTLGTALMVLEETKNLILVLNDVEPILAEAPLLNTTYYYFPVAWDIACLVIICSFSFGMTCAYRFGKKMKK